MKKSTVLKLVLISILSPLLSNIIAQSHWESVLVDTDTYKYIVPTASMGNNWMSTSFNDAQWSSGIGGFGFEDGDDNTTLPATSTLYVRKEIQIPTGLVIQSLFMDLDYDDGFVAYLNGTEIARSNNVPAGVPMFNTILSANHEALMYSGGLPERFVLDPTLLKEGSNLISFQFMNRTISSSDMSARIFLHAKIQSVETLFHPTPVWFIPPLDFTESHLPIINIDTQGKIIVDDPKIDAIMGVIDNGKGNINYVSGAFNHYNGSIGIELRGESSLTSVKSSYRFETRDFLGENLNVPLLGLPKENDWILYGPYIDKSLIRNMLIYHVGEQTGRYVSRTVPCELMVNGEYMGVYVLMEKIKQDDNRVNIAKLNEVDNVGSALSGGYIIRMDKTDVGTVSFSSGLQYLDRAKVTLQYYEPASDVITSQQKTYIKKYVTDFENTLIGSDFSNPETGYHKFIDAGSFVDFMLTNEVALEVDRYKFSTYFFKEKDMDGNKLHAGPVWDADRGIGNDVNWPYGQWGDVWQYNYGTKTDGRVYWWERLMQDTYFQNLFATRWNYLRNSLLSDQTVSNYIDSMAIVLDQPQARNFQRWPVMGVKLYQNTFVGQNYAEEIDYLSTWTLDRLHWIDANIPGKVLHPQARITLDKVKSTDEKFVVRLQLTDDYFNRSIFKNKNFKLNNEGEFIQKDTILYVDASTVELHLKKLNQGATLPADFTITTLAKVVNTSVDLESNSFDKVNGRLDNVPTFNLKAYFDQNYLILNCEDPDLLGNALEVYDTMGKLMISSRLSKTKINKIETHLKSAVYLLKYYINNQLIVTKCIR